MENFIFVGIEGHVCCINTADGRELWRTKLTDYHYEELTNVVVGKKAIYAYADGQLYALARATGGIMWSTRPLGDVLKRRILGGFRVPKRPCIIAHSVDQDQSAMLAAVVQAQQEEEEEAARRQTHHDHGGSHMHHHHDD